MKKCTCDRIGFEDVEYQEFGSWGLPICKKCGGGLFNIEKAKEAGVIEG